MFNSKTLSCVLVVFLIAACADGQEKQTVGTIVGAGLGALVGAQFGSGNGQLIGVAVGAVAGGFAGGELGKSLDDADKKKAQETAQNAFEYNKSGQTSTWKNPDTGNEGSYTPLNAERRGVKDCRKFESTVTVDGKTETSIGRACRDQDGTWRIVS